MAAWVQGAMDVLELEASSVLKGTNDLGTLNHPLRIKQQRLSEGAVPIELARLLEGSTHKLCPAAQCVRCSANE
jgi:hypothetical protein